MKRMLSVLLVVMLVLVFAAQATVGVASPPSESGIVSRYEDAGFALIPDFAAGLLAVIGPESPEALCTGELGLGDMQWLDIPAGEDVIKILLKDFGGAAFVVPLAPPAVLCADPPEPIASGTVNLKIVDNDFHATSSDTNRKNSYGYSATGRMTGPDGERFRFSGHVRRLFEADNPPSTIVTSKVHLVPIG